MKRELVSSLSRANLKIERSSPNYEIEVKYHYLKMETNVTCQLLLKGETFFQILMPNAESHFSMSFFWRPYNREKNYSPLDGAIRHQHIFY